MKAIFYNIYKNSIFNLTYTNIMCDIVGDTQLGASKTKPPN